MEIDELGKNLKIWNDALSEAEKHAESQNEIIAVYIAILIKQLELLDQEISNSEDELLKKKFGMISESYMKIALKIAKTI